jgi:predicted TIM-barrel fold metal-dependent hydrolase
VIDASSLIGGSPRLVPAAEYDLRALVRELAQHALPAALVGARSVRHEVANDRVLAAAGSHDGTRLYPVATLNPVQYLNWRSELERVLSGGAVGIRFFPDEQHWSVLSEAFRAIVAAVAGRCPLLVSVSDFGDASAVGAATADFDGPVVLVGGHYTQLGDCLAALERWPNLHLETSRLAQFRGVETVVRCVGARRVLFGSGAPARPIQAPLNAVLSADISEPDKRLILAGNASRLFGLPAEPFVVPIPTRAEHLIDVHGHVGMLGFPTPPVTLPAAVGCHGIDLIVASSARAIVNDAAGGNAEAFAATGDSVRAYVVVNPNDVEASCQALDAAYHADQALGAKLHCNYSGQPTASQACVTMLREVARRGRPLKIHVDGADWDAVLAEVVSAYPDWKVIVAHAGPGTPVRAAAALVERTSNVYLELPTSFPDLPTTREVVRRSGPERLLFGSDTPLLDPAYVLGIYADAGADLARTVAVARDVFGL